MKIKKLLLATLLSVTTLGFISCGGNSDSSPSNLETETEVSSLMTDFKTQVEKISIPSSLENATSEGAQSVKAIVNQNKSLLLGMTANFYEVPDNAKKLANKSSVATIQKWTWEQAGFVINYEVQEVNNLYNITYTLSGQGISYISKGYVYKDGSKAHFDYIVNDISTFVLDWTSTASKGTIKMSSDSFEYISNYNFNDNSGDFKYYISSKLFAEGNWNSQGNGSFTSYANGQKQTYTF